MGFRTSNLLAGLFFFGFAIYSYLNYPEDWFLVVGWTVAAVLAIGSAFKRKAPDAEFDRRDS